MWIVVFALASTWIGAASAGVIRHDVADASYTGLAQSAPYTATGYFQTLNSPGTQTQIQGSGTLITDRWVLTAAHVGLGPGSQAASRRFVIDGVEYGIEQVITDPEWDSGVGIPGGHDLKLIKLDAPVTGITPATLTDGSFNNTNVIGEVATYVGYGTAGDGLTGAAVTRDGSEGTARAGRNTLDQAGETFNTQSGNLTYDDNIIFADFDNPGSPNTYNTYGSATANSLEFLPAFLDSGGGVFVGVGGSNAPTLVAVTSTVIFLNIDNTADNGFEYGDLVGATLISADDLVWINDAIIEPLIAGDYDGDGEVGQSDLDLVLAFWGDPVSDGQAPDSSWINADDVTGGLIGQDELALVLQNWGSTSALLAELDAISALTGLSESELRDIVPEPGTLALLVLGAGGLLMRRRSRD